MVVVVGLLVDVLDVASLGDGGSLDWGLLDNLDLIVVGVHMGLNSVVVIGALVEVLVSMRVLYSFEVACLVLGVSLGWLMMGDNWLMMGHNWLMVGDNWLMMCDNWLVVGMHGLVVGMHWLVMSSVGVDVGGHFCWLDFYKII